MEPILICAIVFGTIIAVILGPGYLKSRERMKMQDNLRIAIEKGQPLPPEVIDAVARATDVLPTRTKDFRKAVILLAVAASFATIGFIAQQYSIDDHGNGAPVLWGIATIPGFIGLAFLLLGFTGKKTA
jgi:hypothetical protein